jgi:flagellin-like protein
VTAFVNTHTKNMRYTETTKDDSAVSPVIGVILMVAITVILAAVIGTFVLGLGDQVEQNARAGINADVDAADQNVSISVTTLDNSDYVLVRGAGSLNVYGSPNASDGDPVSDNVYLSQTGTNVQLGGTSDSGTLTIVAVIGESPSGVSNGDIDAGNAPDGATTTTVQTIEYDF